jgi:DNA-binding FadR family transcriptional regulator
VLSWRIAAQIRAALFAGKLAPGDFLGTEGSLAREFGVSRMVSRDALRGLEATGIVEILQGAKGGVRVAPGNLDRCADALAIQLKLAGVTDVEALDARIALESVSAELAAQRATADDRARLRRLLDESAALVVDPDAFAASAVGFHLAVAEASGNRAIVTQLRALHHVLEPVHAREAAAETAARVVAAHREVLARIEVGDADGARIAMCGHLEVVRTRRSAAAGAGQQKAPGAPARETAPRRQRVVAGRRRRAS